MPDINNNLVALAVHTNPDRSYEIIARVRGDLPGSEDYPEFHRNWEKGPPESWEAFMKEHYEFLVWCDKLAQATNAPVFVGVLDLINFFEQTRWNTAGFLPGWTVTQTLPTIFIDLRGVSALMLTRGGQEALPTHSYRKFSSANEAAHATFAIMENLQRIFAGITQAAGIFDQIRLIASESGKQS